MVGMLEQQGDQGDKELDCGNHAATLLSKLPRDLKVTFKRFIYIWNVTLPTLLDLAEWLRYELKVQEDVVEGVGEEPTHVKKANRRDYRPTTILFSEAAKNGTGKRGKPTVHIVTATTAT